jgi:sialate O-acetylesterase
MKSFAFVIASIAMLCVDLPRSLAQSTTPLPLVATVFSDNMVLQRNQQDPIWGWTSPGSTVIVTFDGKSWPAIANSTGEWSSRLPALPAGGPYTLIVSGPTTVTFQNVLEGDVWVCSGQSNMEFGIGIANNAAQEIVAANYPDIRINLQPHQIGNSPQQTNGGTWQVVTPQTIQQNGWSGFSAVGYFFGRDLYQSLHVPIGLIESSWGGTVAESWTSNAALRQNLPEFSSTIDQIDGSTPMTTVKIDQNSPTELFNGMIAPLIPYGIKGVIWYQGESNSGRAQQYRKLLPTLIADWRAQWNEGVFPFYIVQIANWGETPAQPTDDGWVELQDAQAFTARTVPNSGLAVIDDIGDPANIHPKTKQEVGRRLALIALAKTYGKSGEYSGPLYKDYSIVGSNVVISFTHLTGGLVSKDGLPLTGFAIAGSDQKFVWADAKIQGKTVVVSSPAVPNPTAVRFAWSPTPVFNLYNGFGLPAAQFRTDEPVPATPIKLPINAGKNLALNATYVTSDPNTWGWSGGLTDGNWDNGTGSTWASSSTDSFPKTATIDLTSSAAIGLVEVGVPPFGSTKTIAISLSADGTNFTTVGSYVFTPGKEERHLYSFPPVNARYIRLTYPDHYDQQVGPYSNTFVFTEEVEAYAPGT